MRKAQSSLSLVVCVLVLFTVNIANAQDQDTPTQAPPAAAVIDETPDAPTSDAQTPETTESPAVSIENPTASSEDSHGKRRSATRTSKTTYASAVIQEPAQGRPIFITPGDTFYFVMRLPDDLRGSVNFNLRHVQEPTIKPVLKPKTPPAYHDEYCSLILRVPENILPGLYDVEVRANGASYVSHHSVRVIDKFKDKFRFVHLSDMNIGDLTAPEFDEMLPREINLLAPEFIIATGNYTEWARAKDDAASWDRVLKFFQKFDAPVFMLCGLHDHEASFTDFVASKPIGTIDYGNYHGLLLLDHPSNPIAQDYSQLRWVETDLKHNRHKTFNFIATNSDELTLLDIWRETGDIQSFIKEHKIKMFIVGGSTDWDYREFASKLKGVDDLHFIRTHQASTSLRDRATGVSHYRVIEVDGDQIAYAYPNDVASEKLLHSVPTGRLRAFYDGRNDGTSSASGVTIQNALNQPFENAHVLLRVAKDAQNKAPKVSTGRIERILDAGDYWACDVAVNLPDKGAITVVASTQPEMLPPPMPLAVEYQGQPDWSFTSERTDFGLNFFASETPAGLKFTNNADVPITCWPVISVNGMQLRLDRTACPRLPLSLEPGETVSVPLTLTLRRLSPGPHKLQVHFLEDPLCRVQTFDVDINPLQMAAGEDDS